MYERAFGHDMPGRMVKDTLLVDWPAHTAYLRNLFDAISTRRQRGQEGPMTITHSDVEAALRRQGLDLAPWEHAALDAMEAGWMKAVKEVIKDDQERHQKPGR
jgi:hypothetical protein